MRIIQVVSVVSPDNRYGGPTTVALNQVRALRAAGHEVKWLAGGMGYDTPPQEYLGQSIELFSIFGLIPGTGFAGLCAPALLPRLNALLRGADAVHVHLARDLLSLPVAELARRRGVRYTVQPHGMIDSSDRILAGPLDAVLTRRVLRGAAAVFYLTPQERNDLREIAGEQINLRELPNGIDSGPVVEAARAPGDVPEVLFMARLHERKRPMMFVAAARELSEEFPQVRFRLLGPDEGEGAAVRAAVAAAGLGDRLRWDGAIKPELAHVALNRAAVYVLPAIDEPYPMTVLEAMRAGLPVILTDSCGLAPAVAGARAGTVIDSEQQTLTNAIRRYLAQPAVRVADGQRARDLIRSRFAMGPIARRLVFAYLPPNEPQEAV